MNEYVVGIDVGGTNIKILVTTPDLDVVDSCSIPTHKHLGYGVISDNIIAAIEGLFTKKEIAQPKIISIGMGLPGVVDKKANKTVLLAYLEWNGFNPCEKIGHHFNAPTAIDNDASLNALGEFKFGNKDHYKDIVLITLGTGVGCGIIINGEVFRGSQNLAAELGHMTLVAEADAEKCCFCGKEGCLEAYCSGMAMERYAYKMMPEFPNSVVHDYLAENNDVYDNAFISKGAAAGDALCVLVMDRYVKYLSVGVANIMKLFNPELVLIGGGISNAGEVLLNPLRKNVKGLVLHERQYCRIEKAVLGGKAGMYGACALAVLKIGKPDKN